MSDRSADLQLDFKEAARKYWDWMASPAGIVSQMVSDKRIEQTKALLAKGRDITHEALHAPFTI